MTKIRNRRRLPGDVLAERFWPKVEPTGFCWEWTAYHTVHGYAKFWDGFTMIVAHRFAFERLVGPIEDGLVLDHLCRNRGCVNPDHLEPVTPEENHLRGVYFLRTECRKGHPYVEGSYMPRHTHGRLCRECNRGYQRKTRERERAERRSNEA